MRIPIVRIVYLFFFLFLYFFSGSQNLLFKNYNVKEGLPSSETYEVFQDSKGFIWVATDRGVSRFDGYGFKTFTTDDGLLDNVNFGFYEDRSGRIWLKGYSDRICYYQDGKFHPLILNTPLPDPDKNRICASMYVDETDTLWLGFEKGPNYMRIGLESSTGKFGYILTPFKKLNAIFFKEIKNSGSIYGTADGLAKKPVFRVYIKNNLTEIDLNDHNCIAGSIPNIHAVRTSANTVLLSRGSVLHEFNADSTLSIISFRSIIISMMPDNQGLWVGTKSMGLNYFPDRKNLDSCIVYLKNLSVSSIVKDKEGGYWFSTLENGIYYLPNINFNHYSRAEGLSDDKVNGLSVSPDNRLWLSLNNGNVAYIKNGKIAKEFNCNLRLNSVNNISDIHYLDNGDVIVGGEFLSVIKNGKTRPSLFNAVFSKKTVIYNDTLFIAGYNIVTATTLNNNNKPKIIEVGRRVNCLLKDKGNDLFLGTPYGLMKYNGFEFKPYLGDAINFRIDDIKKDERGYLWIISKGKGLFAIKGTQILSINKGKGLASNFCSSVFIDPDNIVWVGTNYGISKISLKSYDPLIYEIENYTTANGLISNEINQIVVKENSVYVATNNGVSILNKEKLKLNKVEPKVYITKFQVNDSVHPLLKQYDLKYDENFIEVHFIGLSYQNAGNVQYKYRLIGLDSAWHYAKSTSVDFTTLPPGNYVFEIMAQNNDGYWNKKAVSIGFRIFPPFWHTWWFIAISLVILIVLVFLFIRYRIRVVEKRANEKTLLFKKSAEAEKEKLELFQKASDMEMRFLGSQMNPHFTFNAMNSIQKFIIHKDPLTAQRYLAKYSRLIRRVLENTMQPFVKLEQEIEMLELYLDIESVRFENKFDFEIALPEDSEIREYKVPPMIMQPYVENAIWHGLSNKKDGAGKILLHFSFEKECVKCVIEDNGIGRERAALYSVKKEHTSVGMLITSQRLKQLHLKNHLNIQNVITDLKDEKGVSLGTSVEVYLPVSK